MSKLISFILRLWYVPNDVYVSMYVRNSAQDCFTKNVSYQFSVAFLIYWKLRLFLYENVRIRKHQEEYPIVYVCYDYFSKLFCSL